MDSATGAISRDDLLKNLADRGIAGTEDFGRFINNVAYFRPSSLSQ